MKTDYKKMLEAYMGYVLAVEGTTFIDSPNDTGSLSEAEGLELARISDKVCEAEFGISEETIEPSKPNDAAKPKPLTAKDGSITLKVEYCGMGKDTRHATKVMSDLGIEYESSEGASICDAFFFYGCTNVPDTLPNYVVRSPRNP